jgi:hypothetical protein
MTDVEKIYKSRVDHSHQAGLEAVWDAGVAHGIESAAPLPDSTPKPLPADDPPAPQEAENGHEETGEAPETEESAKPEASEGIQPAG